MKQYFWPRLQDTMVDRGVTQAELLHLCEPIAEATGVNITRSNISRYCRGLSIPRDDKMAVLAAALDVDPSWLSGDIPDTQRDGYPGQHTHHDIYGALWHLAEVAENDIRAGGTGCTTYCTDMDQNSAYVVTVSHTHPVTSEQVELMMQSVNSVIECSSRRDIVLLAKVARAIAVGGVEKEMLKRIFPVWDDFNRKTHPGNPKKMKNSSPRGHTPCGLSDFSADLAQKPLISKDSVNVKNQSLTNAKNNVIEFRVRQQKEKVAFF